MRFATRCALAAFLLALAPRAAHAQAQTVPGRIVAATGQAVTLPGGGTGTLTAINEAFVDAAGRPGFTGTLDSGARIVWYDTGVRFVSTQVTTHTLTGGESTMGIGDGGTFIYSPSVDGNDACWTDMGLVARDSEPAPGLPGEFYSFCSRPTMTPGGTAYWVSGLATSPTGSTQRDALFKSTDRTAANAAVVFAVPSPIGGTATDDLSFDYDVSDNDLHVALQVSFVGAATADDAVVLDGAVVAQEGAPTGSGDNWSAFDFVKVNNSGLLLFSGDTGGPTATDEFIARNGTIVLREGATVDGIVLGSEVRGIGLNNNGLVAWAWSSASTSDEVVFVGRHDALAASRRVLRTGDFLDTNNDGTVDYVVNDIEHSSITSQGSFEFADNAVLHVQLDMTPFAGGPAVVANVALDLSGFIPTASAPAPAPAAVTLAAQPNPFREAAAVSLALDRPQAVTVEVHDALGRRVAVLHDGALAAGTAAFRLDGAPLAPGVYVVRAAGEGWTHTARVTRF